MTEIVDVTTIRALNDRFRQSLRGGMLAADVIALGQERQLKILDAVAFTMAASARCHMTGSSFANAMG